MADMQHIRICYEAAKKNPEHLQMTAPSLLTPESMVAPEVATVAAAQKPVTHGLRSFQLKPEGLKGMELLNHMATFARRQSGDIFEPVDRLDLEITDVQKKILNPTAQDLTCREIMRDAGGSGATQKLAKRKLDTLAVVKAHCGIANSEERIAQLTRASQLASSMSEIQRVTQAEKKTKKVQQRTALFDLAPEAVAKLKTKNIDPTKLTTKEITAILLRYFGADEPKGKNANFVEALQDAIDKNADALSFVGTTATAVIRTLAPIPESDDDDDDDVPPPEAEPSRRSVRPKATISYANDGDDGGDDDDDMSDSP